MQLFRTLSERIRSFQYIAGIGRYVRFKAKREQISRDWTRVDAPGALTAFEKLNQGVHWFADQMRRGESNA
jgi:hypothetical protein